MVQKRGSVLVTLLKCMVIKASSGRFSNRGVMPAVTSLRMASPWHGTDAARATRWLQAQGKVHRAMRAVRKREGVACAGEIVRKTRGSCARRGNHEPSAVARPTLQLAN
jgi:hypothetical protein